MPTLRCSKVEGKIKIPAGPMETKTMAMLHFQPYKVDPIILAHNPFPSYYIKPMSKFVGESLTKSTYKGEAGTRALPAKKSTDSNIKIDKNESLDSSTDYRDAYVNHGLSICEAKAYLIAKALPKNKNQEKRSKKDSRSSV